MDDSKMISTVTLTNTQQYPFNDSLVTVALERSMPDREYMVMTEVVSAQGDVGDVVVTGKAVNGFKLAFLGSAPEAVIRYRVIGGAG